MRSRISRSERRVFAAFPDFCRRAPSSRLLQEWARPPVAAKTLRLILSASGRAESVPTMTTIFAHSLTSKVYPALEAEHYVSQRSGDGFTRLPPSRVRRWVELIPYESGPRNQFLPGPGFVSGWTPARDAGPLAVPRGDSQPLTYGCEGGVLPKRSFTGKAFSERSSSSLRTSLLVASERSRRCFIVAASFSLGM